VFVELVDHYGHINGPDSDEVKNAIRQVDAKLVEVLDALEQTTNINVMVFSDHGMGQRLGSTRGLINVLDYVNSSDWKHAAGSKSAPGLQIWPQDNKLDFVSSNDRYQNKSTGTREKNIGGQPFFYMAFACCVDVHCIHGECAHVQHVEGEP